MKSHHAIAEDRAHPLRPELVHVPQAKVGRHSVLGILGLLLFSVTASLSLAAVPASASGITVTLEGPPKTIPAQAGTYVTLIAKANVAVLPRGFSLAVYRQNPDTMRWGLEQNCGAVTSCYVSVSNISAGTYAYIAVVQNGRILGGGSSGLRYFVWI